LKNNSQRFACSKETSGYLWILLLKFINIPTRVASKRGLER